MSALTSAQVSGDPMKAYLYSASNMGEAVHALATLILEQNNTDTFGYAAALVACAEKLGESVNMALEVIEKAP